MEETEEHSPSLREALEAAASREEAAPEPAADAGVARDEAGRFTPKDTAPAAAADDYDEATGFDRDEWTATPQTAREKAKELAKARREAEDRAKAYEPLERVLAPRRDALRATHGDEGQALERLFHLSDWATRDFAGFVRHLATERGIDLRTLAPEAQAAPAQEDPRAVIRAEVEREIAARESERQLRDFEGNAAYEHRNEPIIRRVMSGLLTSGAASDLTTAYSMAVKAHPEYGPKQLAAEAAARAKAEAEERAKQERSKAASAATSLRGSPGLASASAPDAGSEDLRATLERFASAAY